MMTRRALARQEESKLQLALKELKASKELCAQLNSERDDNEKELLGMLKSNEKLKSDLSALHIRYDNVVEQRDRLQELVDRFDECRAEYEATLNKISALQQQLDEAHNKISELQTAAQNTTAQHTQSLFEELVGSAPQLVTATTDEPNFCTDHSLPQVNYTNPSKVYPCSSKKLKKYVKINRYVRKTQKLINKQNYSFKSLKPKKDRLELLGKIKMYKDELEICKSNYESDIHILEVQIARLQASLRSLSAKYDSCQKNMMSEYTQTADELDQLTGIENTISSQKKCSDDGEGSPQSVSTASSPSKMRKVCDRFPIQNTNSSFTHTKPSTCNTKTFMYSDGIGSGMGILLHSHLQGHTVLNSCSPDSGLISIVRSIYRNRNSFDLNTNLVIFVANRGTVNEYELKKCYQTLEKLNVNNIIIYTFPYCDNLPHQENTYRYKLNKTLYNLCTYNNKFKIVDINTQCGKVYYDMDQDRYKLSCYSRRQIAISLSYIFQSLAKNVAKQAASIEQCFNSDILDINPSNFTLN